MPTAQDFRQGVTDIDAEIDNIATTQRICDQYTDDFGFTGGVAGTVKEALVAGSGNAAKVGTLVEALREEMNRKARLCDQFTQDMRDHVAAHAAWSAVKQTYSDTPRGLRHEVTAPGWEPQPPPPPFAGAEASP